MSTFELVVRPTDFRSGPSITWKRTAIQTIEPSRSVESPQVQFTLYLPIVQYFSNPKTVLCPYTVFIVEELLGIVQLLHFSTYDSAQLALVQLYSELNDGELPLDVVDCYSKQSIQSMHPLLDTTTFACCDNCVLGVIYSHKTDTLVGSRFLTSTQ